MLTEVVEGEFLLDKVEVEFMVGKDTRIEEVLISSTEVDFFEEVSSAFVFLVVGIFDFVHF